MAAKAGQRSHPRLSYAITQLTTEEEDGTLGRAWTLLVPLDTPGVQVDFGTWDNMCMRASGSNDVIFEDVLIPLENRLPGAPALAQANTNGWSLITSAVYLGIATAARDFAVQYAQERVAERTRQADRRAAKHSAPDRPDRDPAAAGALDPLQHDRNLRAAPGAPGSYRLAIRGGEIHRHQQRDPDHRPGAARHRLPGLLKKYPLERYFRDARAGLGNPPMDDVALTLIGKHALGL